MNRKVVKALVEQALIENDSLFLIDLIFLLDDKIKIVIDGDFGVPVKECVRISREVERHLEQETEDFAIEVSSPDITDPLKVKRQYKKNVGRVLNIKTAAGSFEGILTLLGEDSLVLQYKTREPKPIGKGKITVEKTVTLAHTAIQQARVKVIF